MASNPAILSHAAPSAGGIAQQFGAVRGAADSHPPALAAAPQQHQDAESVRLQFGNFSMGPSSYAGGFGGSHSEAPGFGESASSFGEPSTSFRDSSAPAVEPQAAANDPEATQQLQGAGGAGFKSGVAPGPPGRSSGEFQRQSGEFQPQGGAVQRPPGSIGPPGSAAAGAYAAFVQHHKPQELAPAQGAASAQYSQYGGGYGQQLGGAGFGQVRVVV